MNNQSFLTILMAIIGMFFLTMTSQVQAQENTQKKSGALVQLKVAQPYLDIRTGPSLGYPVIFTLKKDETFTVLQRKTDWFEITSKPKNSRIIKQGWISQEQIETTKIGTKRVKIDTASTNDFNNKKWEFGFSSGLANGGLKEGDPLISIYTSYHITANLAAELGYLQIFGQHSSSLGHQFNITHEISPSWTISPLFSLGVGSISIDPKETLGATQGVKKDAVNYGIGFKYYINKRFFLRTDYNKYLLLSNSNNLDSVDSWKIGLSVFF